MPEVSVAIPVGPHASNTRWLWECLESVRKQTHKAKEIILVDDGAELYYADWGDDLKIWHSPWRLGVAHAFNMGVGLANTECVFMLGSDDTLEPKCLERCVDAYDGMGYYHVCVRYQNGDLQNIPCNAAMVTKSLWLYTGGFPVESAVGAPDAALLSMLYAKRPKLIKQVAENVPLYNYRAHPETETSLRYTTWEPVILEVRDLVTKLWEPKDG